MIFATEFFVSFFSRGLFLKSQLNLLQYCFHCMFWLSGHEACTISFPQAGIKPGPNYIEGEVLTLDWQESPLHLIIYFYY